MKNLFLMICLFIFSLSFAQDNTIVFVEDAVISKIDIPTISDYQRKEKRIFKMIIADIKHIVECSNNLEKLKTVEQKNSAKEGIKEAQKRLQKRCIQLNISNQQINLLIQKYSKEKGYETSISYTLKSKTEYFRNKIIRRGRVALV